MKYKGKWLLLGLFVLFGLMGCAYNEGVNDGQNPDSEKLLRVHTPTAVNIETLNKRVPVANLEHGQEFPFIQVEDNWYKVNFGNHYGYINNEDVDLVTNTEIDIEITETATSNKTVIMLNDTQVFSENTKGALPIATLLEGIEYPILDEDGDWYKINLSNRTGFIKKHEVKEVENPNIADIDFDYYLKRDSAENLSYIRPFFYGPVNRREYLLASDQMLEGIFSIPPFGEFDYTNGITWDENPSNTRSYMRSLHGHFFIYDLVEAFRETGDTKYLLKGQEIIEDWIEKNPLDDPSDAMAWHDETTARRLVSWVNFFDASKDILEEETLQYLLSNMVTHADLLLRDYFYSRNTNHGMFQDEALLVFGDYFNNLHKSETYKEFANKRLKDYFAYIISDEGVHLEHSPSYNQLIANALLKYHHYYGAADNDELSSYYIETYNNMVDYATFIIKPDGQFPSIGDTFLSDTPSSILWSESPHYTYSRTTGAEGTPPDTIDKVFKESGYAIFRDAWTLKEKATYILFVAAYHTSYHKHSDELNLWIYSDGDIIMESGPNGYDYQDPYTEYAYSSFAHNTLIVDNEGLPRVDGKVDQTYLSDYEITDNYSSATGVNDRYENVTHTRKVTHLKNENQIVVNDDIVSKGPHHNYKLLWHLAPDIEIEINGENAELYRDGKQVMTISFSSETSLNINSVYGQEKPQILGWFFKGIKEPIPTNTIIVEFDTDNAEVITTFNILN
ncbi:alginate lyase family protein [Alkalihalobacillus sp. BA299]|uniref:alginate lyase family protein n=1 Tax=Alkalihalobacillus sp. BA299 TaxID=2815938 RepID=UPI001AD97AFE|nr:alginate lyase family protein [Alkalihalobacillus sp. BA299]